MMDLHTHKDSSSPISAFDPHLGNHTRPLDSIHPSTSTSHRDPARNAPRTHGHLQIYSYPLGLDITNRSKGSRLRTLLPLNQSTRAYTSGT